MFSDSRERNREVPYGSSAASAFYHKMFKLPSVNNPEAKRQLHALVSRYTSSAFRDFMFCISLLVCAVEKIPTPRLLAQHLKSTCFRKPQRVQCSYMSFTNTPCVLSSTPAEPREAGPKSAVIETASTPPAFVVFTLSFLIQLSCRELLTAARCLASFYCRLLWSVLHRRGL
jgi:hypothetical protein